MQFIANQSVGGEGTKYSLKRPEWKLPSKLRHELTEAKLGRICHADAMTRHELVGEVCRAVPPHAEGGMACDEMWALSIAAEWTIESHGGYGSEGRAMLQ